MRDSKLKAKTIILASASSRRKELLKRIFTRFRVIKPHIKERINNALRHAPRDYVRYLARLKADAVSRRLKDRNALVIGADTIVYARQQIIGKPRNKQDALRILKQLAGTRHSVITGLCLIDTRTGQSVSGYAESIVRMKRLSSDEISRIAATNRHRDKAGGYAIQETGDSYIKLVRGSLSNAVGLPLVLVRQLTRRLLSSSETA